MLDFPRFHYKLRNSKRRVAVYKYVQGNIEALSCNLCFCGKAIIITYSKCVFISLMIQLTKRMRPIKLVIFGLSVCTAFFHVVSLTAWFPAKFMKQKVCVLRLSSTLSESFLILWRIRQDIIINVHRLSLFLSDFNSTWTLSTLFRINTQTSIDAWKPTNAPINHSMH
jgi:hypothetical protein